jgi:hypothetical protein
MQQLHIPLSVFKPRPPPLWYVTNGEIKVGPVLTGLLKKGVEYGRVPDYCKVAPYGGAWRKLKSVREIAALDSKNRNATVANKPPTGDRLVELSRPIGRIRDEDELCYHVTRISLIATGAESGMFHFRSRSARGLTTRCVLGPMSSERLNESLPDNDLVMRAAKLGRPISGPPYGPTEDALSIRFATSNGGVGGAAMIPIFVGNTLMAMLELSRPGHAFRRSDLQRAERIVWRALYQHSS